LNHFLLVTKRDGKTERINLDKINRVLDWAAEGLSNVKVSRIERGHFPISTRAIASAVKQSLESLAEYLVVPTIIGDIKSGHLTYLTPSMRPLRKLFVKLLNEVCKLPRSPPFKIIRFNFIHEFPEYKLQTDIYLPNVNHTPIVPDGTALIRPMVPCQSAPAFATLP